MSLDTIVIAFLSIFCVALAILAWWQDDRINQLQQYIDLHDRDWDHD
jgi:hypothetical protein